MGGVSDSPYWQAVMPLVITTIAFTVAFPPLLLHLFMNPFTYVVSTISVPERISTLQHKFFYYTYRVLSPMFDARDKPMKTPLLKMARGTVLEVGPGVGDNIKYYTSKVDRLILVEPNTNMHEALRQKAKEAGFVEHDGSLLLLGCGAAATVEKALNLAGVGPESIDTIMLIHVLCGIPKPALAIEMYRRFLKPGGLLAFFEHVRSEEPFSANCQSWYTRMFWTHVFDGCHLDRPSGAWIMAGPDAADRDELVTGKELVHGVNGIHRSVQERWSEYQIDAPKDQQRFTLLPHVMGYAIKA